jgi:hypothetical protein
MKTFTSLEELKPYYNKKTNTYEFNEDIELQFDLNVNSHIIAWDINAWDINAWDINSLDINAGNIKAKEINAGNIKAYNIKAWNIKARDIKACNINSLDISYYAVCYAYINIECKSIKGRRVNSKHFVLDGKITFKKDEPKKSVTLELTQEQLEKIKEILGEEEK